MSNNPLPGDPGQPDQEPAAFPPPDEPGATPLDDALTEADLDDESVIEESTDRADRSAERSTETAGTDAAAIATVIVVNYNGAHLLGPCLDGLARQDLPAGTFRTVVVDNASADPSRDLLREDYPDVELLVSHHNLGFAGGNNLALERVTTPYAVLLNNDAVPEPSWLRTLLAPLQQDTSGSLAATSSKIVFMPEFVEVKLSTEPFKPGGLDPRALGAKVYQISVDGNPVTNKVMWEKAGFGPEGTAHDQYRWSFPEGSFLVPLPPAEPGAEQTPHTITVTIAANQTKEVLFRAAASSARITPPTEVGAIGTVSIPVPVTTPRVDVINNVGGIVFVDGAGADRGFQEVDTGQYEEPEEVFTACGNGVAIRTAAGRAAGWFDDRYFMYYEDVDLCWRLRAAGGRIQYVPGAVLRHLHSASSKPWSPGWVFHVERNRLLTLTKDASAGRAANGVLRFIGSTGKMTLRAVAQGARTRRKPPLGPVMLRGKVLRSYLRHLPGLLADRRRIGNTATVGRRDLEEWLVTSR
ncbi:MAG: glycosyltransferase family 2 protein [Actinomycetota bacterium]|nr:glycosyltransferase family 2 protein [Actinomycetota bacterium]